MQDTSTYGFDIALYRMQVEKIFGMYIKVIRIRQYTKSIIPPILYCNTSIHEPYTIVSRRSQGLY